MRVRYQWSFETPRETSGLRAPTGGREVLPATISLETLDLVWLDLGALRAIQSGDAITGATLLGWDNPHRLFIDEEAWMSRLFGRRLIEDPRNDTWLVRAIVHRDTNTLVGHLGGHQGPDERRCVEIGYTVGEGARGQGIATAAARGFLDAMASSGEVSLARASISPSNLASLAVARKLGMIEVGSQIDDIDGLELIFETRLTTPNHESLSP